MTSQKEIISQSIIREPQTEVEPMMHRYRWRVMRKLDRYDIYDVFGYTYIMVINEFDDDYVSYSKAMASSKANI